MELHVVRTLSSRRTAFENDTFGTEPKNVNCVREVRAGVVMKSFAAVLNDELSSMAGDIER